jgi:hypothetical protein
MNKVLMPLLFSAFILTGTSFAQTPPPAADQPAAAPVAAAPETVKPAHHMHAPEIHKAMRKLRGAKADLEKAAHDYGGHRVKAIEDINQALEELKAALESDTK